jgi:hypothetical protein
LRTANYQEIRCCEGHSCPSILRAEKKGGTKTGTQTSTPLTPTGRGLENSERAGDGSGERISAIPLLLLLFFPTKERKNYIQRKAKYKSN